ncbi:MAG: 2-amino-4-hydroxy-6-hydroxymethyldihydropteridine diphosphokinase [Burkholderiaceae bacterium]|nr:2-amino-4-hydroxy-6-hydroxymethyldihydropteridine diphosphokinase [Burkholderiaceae bacterium]MCD8517097.1 2-amino-4-hydroxy-6-hydroxymethyldihydropteridine diphosphokinase [Burkholderiaceae bacterium]MCD8536330.1 2-amino-4-hydroxy-6-hydroxymethyldihydropteridine diphosphokinase [Burkholderiaceae bacterium]MCD8566116.1 2-amino-4-hydroxy-6-hydroxymethyldihydropteridine diphosphokinase [Burkholderiaceae bacterium]
MSTATAYIGMGANLGDAKATLTAAIEALRRTAGVIDAQSSSFYCSDPVDAPGPPYVNAVAKLTTTLAPLPLLQTLRAIEAQHGRERHFRNAPRTLDLDLLLYDELKFSTPTLVVPHPRMHLRAFVLKPLTELGALNTVIQDRPLADWLAACQEQPCEPI